MNGKIHGRNRGKHRPDLCCTSTLLVVYYNANVSLIQMASRIFVQDSISDKFINLLKESFETASKSNIIGDPSDKNTQVGPLADKAQFKRVMEFLEVGKKDGELVTGGIQRGKNGLFVEPTIFKNTPNGSRIVQEEVFGPVVTVQTFKGEEDAIKMANDTVFGLSGNELRSGSTSLDISLTSHSVRLHRFHQPCAPCHP